MSTLFRASHRTLQRRFDTERLADRIEERLFREHLDADGKAFIERLSMFFLATADTSGQPSCSYKGGDPGFVRVLDPRTLAFPCYDGNGMFLSMGNLSENPAVGLLFIDFESPRRLRVNGDARIESPDSVDPPFEGAQLVVKVAVRQVFPNCPRYVHEAGAAERSPYVPRPGEKAPIPAWKQAGWARDVLPGCDPARDED